MDESDLMARLGRLVAAPAAQAILRPMAASLEQALAEDPGRAKSTFAAVPLATYGARLPISIRSSWLFALRGGIAHPPERHPNSIQRMFALSAPGTFETWVGGAWQRHRLEPGDSGLSIAIDTWHRMPAQRGQWTVVSFHTVAPEELVEIVGDPETGAEAGSRLYLPG